jgi:hypothetical protein
LGTETILHAVPSSDRLGIMSVVWLGRDRERRGGAWSTVEADTEDEEEGEGVRAEEKEAKAEACEARIDSREREERVWATSVELRTRRVSVGLEEEG